MVLGQMGCGFGAFASGTAAMSNGMAEVRLSNIPANMDFVDVLVFRDADGDGQCTAADTVWQAQLQTSRFNSRATFELAKLDVAAEWTCFAFNAN